MEKRFEILVVDDDEGLASNLQDILESEGYAAAVAYDGQSALALCREKAFDLAIIDNKLPDISGLELINRLTETSGEAVYIIITGYASMESTIEAVRTDRVIAYETKPLDMDRFQSLIRQVFERKQAEEELRESEEKWHSLVENAPNLIMIVEPDGTIQFINRTAPGTSVEETAGRNIYDYIQPEYHDVVRGTIKRVLETGEPGCYEIEGVGPDGSISWYETQVGPVKRNRRVCAVTLIAVDITERKQAEEERVRLETQLQQAQKMEAIGTLAGGIAHDFNNILLLIMGYTELAMHDLPEDSRARDNMNRVLKASERARDLVKQILAFSRYSEQEKKPVQIHLIIKEALKLLRPTLPTTIEIRQNIASTGTVMADPTQMHQVMMNLSTNAYHAMLGKGGILEVSLADVELDSDFAALHLDIHPGPYIKLTVSDTGHGIEEKDIDRIFEPYYTTKAKGKGTGMGFAVVHGIVKSHGGTITVYSKPGEGTTFDVFFPRIEDVEVAAETEEAMPVPMGEERILLVDDEPAIVDIGKRMLESLGYTVVTRTSPIEALEAFKAQPDRFDLVITDMTMPKMTGDELAKKLMKIRPDIPIIVCTGFSERINEDKAKALGIRKLVLKPVVQREMANAVRKALD